MVERTVALLLESEGLAAALLVTAATWVLVCVKREEIADDAFGKPLVVVADIELLELPELLTVAFALVMELALCE